MPRLQITANLLDVGYEDTIKFSGPATASAVAISAGVILEYVASSDVVQAATDATTGVFFGIASKDYALSATDVVAYHGVVAEFPSDGAHDIGTPAYAVAGGASVSPTSSLGPRVGTFVGPRSAANKSKVLFTVGGGPALS